MIEYILYEDALAVEMTDDAVGDDMLL